MTYDPAKFIVTGDRTDPDGATWTYVNNDDGTDYDLNGYIRTPSGDGPWSTIILLHGTEGLNPYSDTAADEMVGWGTDGAAIISVMLTHDSGDAGKPVGLDGASDANMLRISKIVEIAKGLLYVIPLRMAMHGVGYGGYAAIRWVSENNSDIVAASTVSAGTHDEYTSDANTIALYHFEGKGGSVIDASGNGYSGTNFNTPDSGIPAVYGAQAFGPDAQTDRVHFAGGVGSLVGAIDGLEGTVEGNFEFDSATRWTDSTEYVMWHFEQDANNYIKARKTVSDTLNFQMMRGGVLSEVNAAPPTSDADVHHYAMSWDSVADELIAYVDGVQFGSTQTALGTWVVGDGEGRIGNDTSDTKGWIGRYDEFRISDVARLPSPAGADTFHPALLPPAPTRAHAEAIITPWTAHHSFSDTTIDQQEGADFDAYIGTIDSEYVTSYGTNTHAQMLHDSAMYTAVEAWYVSHGVFTFPSIQIDWPTGLITVPRSFLTLIDSDNALYEMDIDTFRLELKRQEADEQGMMWPDTHSHFTEVTAGGVTYARVIAILDPYHVQFEDAQYGVNMVGANSNIADVLIRNQVSVLSNNSAGLINPNVTASDLAAVPGDVWSYVIATAGAPVSSLAAGSAARFLAENNIGAVGRIEMDFTTDPVEQHYYDFDDNLLLTRYFRTDVGEKVTTQTGVQTKRLTDPDVYESP